MKPLRRGNDNKEEYSFPIDSKDNWYSSTRRFSFCKVTKFIIWITMVFFLADQAVGGIEIPGGEDFVQGFCRGSLKAQSCGDVGETVGKWIADRLTTLRRGKEWQENAAPLAYRTESKACFIGPVGATHCCARDERLWVRYEGPQLPTPSNRIPFTLACRQ